METTEGNKLIIEFIGAERNCYSSSENPLYSVFYTRFIRDILDKEDEGETSCFLKDMRFHSSWEWIMPVIDYIEKIANTEVRIECKRMSLIVSNGLPFGNKSKEFNALATENGNKIYNLWSLVVQFIQWYNKQNAIKITTYE